MLLRRPHELAGLFRDARKRAGWSQQDLADRVGVSRQWVSLVETGKTSVEFDLVHASLRALGYGVFVESEDHREAGETRPMDRPAKSRSVSRRTPLTRNGEPIRGAALGRRRANTGPDDS